MWHNLSVFSCHINALVFHFLVILALLAIVTTISNSIVLPADAARNPQGLRDFGSFVEGSQMWAANGRFTVIYLSPLNPDGREPS